MDASDASDASDLAQCRDQASACATLEFSMQGFPGVRLTYRAFA